MNTSTLRYILDRYDPENDAAPISNADAALLEMVIDLAERVQELEAMLKPAPALVQPCMFPAGEDAPLFTLPAELTGAALGAAIARGDYEDSPICSRCGRHPAESGRAYWPECGACGAPTCDTCSYAPVDGHFCSANCWHAATD